MKQEKQIRHLLADSLHIAFPGKMWFVLFVSYLGIATPLLFSFGYSSKELWQNSFHYILSAQAQTLGTILALIFTFTLVTAQLVTRYSHLLLQRVLAPWTFWYAIPFLIGIIAPLFLLNGLFYLWAARLTLLLGGMCIILLLPFFAAIRRQLSMASVMDELRDCICKSKSDLQVTNGVKSISAISTGALNLRDYETFNLGIECLGQASQINSSTERVLIIALELRNLVSRSGNDQVAMEASVHMLNKVTLYIANREDKDIVKKLITNLANAYENLPPSFLRDSINKVKIVKDLGVEETANPDNGITRECQKLIHKVGHVIISESHIEEELTHVVISALGDLAFTSIDEPASTARDTNILASIRLIEDLGSVAIKNRLQDTTQSVLVQLRRIEKAINTINQDLFRAAKAARISVETSMGE